MEKTVLNKHVKDNVIYFTAPIFEKAGIKHAFATRIGGVSEDYFSEMNMGFTTGDDPEKVMENHKIFARAIGYDEKKLVFPNQLHTDAVRRVSSEDAGKGIVRKSDFVGVDGLITNDPDILLPTFFADCVPLLLYDKMNNAIGAVHSGWRGTVARIGRNAVEKMGIEFGTKPEDLLVVIGPSICQDCYEVSEDVAIEFLKEFGEKNCKELLYQKSEQIEEGKYQLNLWKANEIIFKECGVKEENIQIAALCTCCNHELLFSHRATNGKRGSMMAVISVN